MGVLQQLRVGVYDVEDDIGNVRLVFDVPWDY